MFNNSYINKKIIHDEPKHEMHKCLYKSANNIISAYKMIYNFRLLTGYIKSANDTSSA